MATLTLYFVKAFSPELERVDYLAGDDREVAQQSIRGTSTGGDRNIATFPWTSAVQALSLVLSETKLAGMRAARFSFSGEQGSPAASLDYAIAKRPQWLQDMFGISRDGELLARRLFLRVNPERKRPGPVRITVNSSLLPVENIKIFLDENQLTSLHDIETFVARLRNCLSSQNGVKQTESKSRLRSKESTSLEMHNRSEAILTASVGPGAGSSFSLSNSDAVADKGPGLHIAGFDAERIDALIGPQQSERYRAYLEEILDIEIMENLGETRLFSPKDVKGTLDRAVSPGVFKRAYGKGSFDLACGHLMQRPPLPHSSSELVRRLYHRQRPLFVQLTALQSTNIAIFHAMKLQGIPLHYDFSLLYSSDVVRLADASESFDMCVIGIAAGAGLVNKRSPEFVPTVLMARGTQRMVETAASRTSVRSKHNLLHLGPSKDTNTFWFYSHMLESQLVKSKDFKCSEESPTDFFLNAMANDVEGACLMAFPFIHFLPSGLQVARNITIPKEISDKETVLFSSKELLRDDIFMQSFISCMFDTWLRLLESSQYRAHVVRSLCRDSSYPLALLRTMGLTLGSSAVRDLFSRGFDARKDRLRDLGAGVGHVSR